MTKKAPQPKRKPQKRPVGLLQELVLPAGPREERPELGVGEGSGQGQEPARHPEQRGSAPRGAATRAMSPVVMKMPVPRTEPMVSEGGVPGAQAPDELRRSGVLGCLAHGSRDSNPGRPEAACYTSNAYVERQRSASAWARAAPTSRPASLLQRAVWGLADLEITSAIQLIATIHAGGFVHLAETADGAGGGLRLRVPRPARAASPTFTPTCWRCCRSTRSAASGSRLKWAQRDEALARGVGLISWTYDPCRPATPT